MRPTHVVLVGECVQRFAERSPSLTAAVKEHGPLPLPGLVRHCFRNTDPCDTNTMIDSAFGALRMMQSVEGWVTSNNELYDSLEGLSDREAPESHPTNLIAAQLLAQSNNP